MKVKQTEAWPENRYWRRYYAHSVCLSMIFTVWFVTAAHARPPAAHEQIEKDGSFAYATRVIYAPRCCLCRRRLLPLYACRRAGVFSSPLLRPLCAVIGAGRRTYASPPPVPLRYGVRAARSSFRRAGHNGTQPRRAAYSGAQARRCSPIAIQVVSA